MMKGIILAGGFGTRLFPMTKAVSKHLLPVGDKPMIYYPLSTLMLCGIKEVIIIVKPIDQASFRLLLGDGSQLGMKISYIEQSHPNGIPECFSLAEQEIEGQQVCLILGDNIFFGAQLTEVLKQSLTDNRGATIFCQQVEKPENYGIIEKVGKTIKSIEEKPKVPRSNLGISGLYIFDKTVSARARKLTKSLRGEVEIVELISQYEAEGILSFLEFGRGVTWFDAGTPQDFLSVNNQISSIQNRQKIQIGSIEEIAFRNGWITPSQLEDLADSLGDTNYAACLRVLLRAENA